MSFNVGNITVTVAGESHANALTVIIEGIKAGEKVNIEEIYKFMRRRMASGSISTSRHETDMPEILSGVKNGYATGAAISAIIRNNDVKSGDYGTELDIPRPGHADYPASVKFGKYFDFCGGGQFSGRITAPICFAGGLAKSILKEKGIDVFAHISSIHGIEDAQFSEIGICDVSSKDFPVISDEKGKLMIDEIQKAASKGDSVGGSIECAVTGLKPGMGDCLFGGLDGELAKAVFAVPSVKGIEFGAGFDVCKMFGSENNDSYEIKDGKIVTSSNNHGGILGGMSSGMPILFNVAVKPTPSISVEQDSVSLKNMTSEKLSVKGRHDPCIVHRATACIEAVCALVILGFSE